MFTGKYIVIFIVFQGNAIRILKYFYIFVVTNIYFNSNGTTMRHRRTSKRGQINAF